MFNFFKKESPSIDVEVFKGKLEKTAVLDSVKKEFAENYELKEATLLTKGVDDALMVPMQKMLNLNVNISDEFDSSYLVYITNKGKVFKIVLIITEGLESGFQALMEEKKFVLRIVK